MASSPRDYHIASSFNDLEVIKNSVLNNETCKAPPTVLSAEDSDWWKDYDVISHDISTVSTSSEAILTEAASTLPTRGSTTAEAELEDVMENKRVELLEKEAGTANRSDNLETEENIMKRSHINKSPDC